MAEHVSSPLWKIFVTHLQRNYVVAVRETDSVLDLKKEILKSHAALQSRFHGEGVLSPPATSLSPDSIGLFLLNNYELCNHNRISDVLYDGAYITTSHSDPLSIRMPQNSYNSPPQLPYSLHPSSTFNFPRPQSAFPQNFIPTIPDSSVRMTDSYMYSVKRPEYSRPDELTHSLTAKPVAVEEEKRTVGAEGEAKGGSSGKGKKRKAESSSEPPTKSKKKKRSSTKKDENNLQDEEEDKATDASKGGGASKSSKKSKKKERSSSSKKTESKSKKEDSATTSSDLLTRSFVRELLSSSSDEDFEETALRTVEASKGVEETGGNGTESCDTEETSIPSKEKEVSTPEQLAVTEDNHHKKKDSKSSKKGSSSLSLKKKGAKKTTKSPKTPVTVSAPTVVAPLENKSNKTKPSTTSTGGSKSKGKTSSVTIDLSSSSDESDDEREEENKGMEEETITNNEVLAAQKPNPPPSSQREKESKEGEKESSRSSESSDENDDTPATKSNTNTGTKNTVETGNTGNENGLSLSEEEEEEEEEGGQKLEKDKETNEVASQDLFAKEDSSSETDSNNESEEIPMQAPVKGTSRKTGSEPAAKLLVETKATKPTKTAAIALTKSATAVYPSGRAPPVKSKTTSTGTQQTLKQSTLSKEDDDDSSSSVSTSEEEEEEKREPVIQKKGGGVTTRSKTTGSGLQALAVDAVPPNKKTLKKTSTLPPSSSKLHQKLKSSPAGIIPAKLSQKRKQQARKIGGLEQLTAVEEKLSQSLSQEDVSQMIANNESVWAV